MASSARCQGDADSDVESTAEELEEEQRERNLTMFSKRHLFVELHELKNNEWHETKRYNYGLEEDLEEGVRPRAPISPPSSQRGLTLATRA